MSAAIRRPRAADLVRAVTPAALILLFVIFAVASPTFRTPGNLLHILVNNFTLPAIVALGMSAMPDQLQIARLKKRKLRIKDEISQLGDELIPDIIA